LAFGYWLKANRSREGPFGSFFVQQFSNWQLAASQTRAKTTIKIKTQNLTADYADKRICVGFLFAISI
jgi:hypothetical protein